MATLAGAEQTRPKMCDIFIQGYVLPLSLRVFICHHRQMMLIME